jgi:hypothetical protein
MALADVVGHRFSRLGAAVTRACIGLKRPTMNVHVQLHALGLTFIETVLCNNCPFIFKLVGSMDYVPLTFLARVQALSGALRIS